MTAEGHDDELWNRALSGDATAWEVCLQDDATLRGYGSSLLHRASEANRGDMVAHLIGKGLGHVNSLDSAKDTPLHMASLYGGVECVRTLLSLRASVDVHNDYSHTALWYALKGDSERKYECARELLCAGSTLEALTVKGDIVPEPWVFAVVEALKQRKRACRSACVALVAITRFKKSSAFPPLFGKDVVSLICARVLSTLDDSCWGDLPPLL